MAENTVKKIATRESYGNSLKELAEEFPNLVVLDADLAAATKTGIFRKAYPRPSYRLWYRRGKHDGCGSRTVPGR